MQHPRLTAFLSLTLAFVGVLGYARAGDDVLLEPGDSAPAFSLPGSDGTTHALADLKGKTVVLAWFPKAFTGG
jgi:hypothetical protein